MLYSIYKYYKRRMQCDIEADSLDEAIELASKSDKWEWFGDKDEYEFEGAEWESDFDDICPLSPKQLDKVKKAWPTNG